MSHYPRRLRQDQPEAEAWEDVRGGAGARRRRAAVEQGLTLVDFTV